MLGYYSGKICKFLFLGRCPYDLFIIPKSKNSIVLYLQTLCQTCFYSALLQEDVPSISRDADRLLCGLKERIFTLESAPTNYLANVVPLIDHIICIIKIRFVDVLPILYSTYSFHQVCRHKHLLSTKQSP